MEVDARHPLKRQHNRLRGEETARLHRWLGWQQPQNRINIGHVEFIRALGAIAVGFVGNLSPMGDGEFGQRLDIFITDQASGRPHPDAIMRRGEVKKCGRVRTLLQTARPGRQIMSIPHPETVDHQWRQRELVHKLRLVRAIPKIGHILGMWHIGLGDDQHIRSDCIQHIPH